MEGGLWIRIGSISFLNFMFRNFYDRKCKGLVEFSLGGVIILKILIFLKVEYYFGMCLEV